VPTATPAPVKTHGHKKPPRPLLRVSSLSAQVKKTRRAGVRRVRLSGCVTGATRGTVAVSVHRAGGAKATAVLRRRIDATGTFSHVQRLRPGAYELQVSYLDALGVRATRRFVVR